MNNHVANVAEQFERAEKEVPTVPALKPAEVNAEAGESQNDASKNPAGPPTERMGYQAVHQIDR